MFASCTLQDQTIDADFAFVGVDIVNVETGQLEQDKTVIILDGKINMIADKDAANLSENTQVIDGTGKFLAPGLVEMHAHVMTNDDLIPYLAHGITTIRSMWGEPSILKMRENVAQGKIDGPRIISSGRMVDGTPPIHFGTGNIGKAEYAAAVVKQQKADGYDFIKTYSNLVPEAFDAVAEASKAEDIYFAGHVPTAVPIRHALKSGMKSMTHFYGYLEGAMKDPSAPNLDSAFDPRVADKLAALGRGEIDLADIYDEQKIDELVQMTVENDVALVPTFEVLKAFSSEFQVPRPEEDRHHPPAVRQMWGMIGMMMQGREDQLKGFAALNKKKYEIFYKIFKAGGTVMVGTDAPNPGVYRGPSVVEEMKNFKRAGMNNMEVLQSATMTPANFNGLEGRSGIIREGADADLILLDSNPLESLDALYKPDGVMVNGKWYTRAELDAMLDVMAEKSATLDAYFAEAPNFGFEFGFPMDFLSDDGRVMRLVQKKDDQKTIIKSAIKNADDQGWQTQEILIENDVVIVSSNGKELIRQEGALPLQGKLTDILLLNIALSGLEVGQNTGVSVVFCSENNLCEADQHTISATRQVNNVFDRSHFYYAGFRHYDLSLSSEKVKTYSMIGMGGGAYQGQIITYATNDDTQPTWQRVK